MSELRLCREARSPPFSSSFLGYKGHFRDAQSLPSTCVSSDYLSVGRSDCFSVCGFRLEDYQKINHEQFAAVASQVLQRCFEMDWAAKSVKRRTAFVLDSSFYCSVKLLCMYACACMHVCMFVRMHVW